ncbi:carbohydrate-binding protein [Paenibacillus chitinolyticus]|uniref:carbohydrate-binding protein n=1 Tax=Paenibacillus chitinolyticus TaxID=79263 RepID=UPI003644CA0C
MTVTTDIGSSAATWTAYTTYQVNDLVTYQVKTYRTLQGHMAMPGWEMANVPALWTFVS